jgi:hypothetical protein
LVLHDSQKLVTIPRSEIERIQPTTNSLMPEGLLKPLSETEIAQLLAYLQSPSQVPLADAVPPIDEAFGRVPGAIEGESLMGKTTLGTASAQGMSGFPAGRWSGKSQLWWTGAKPEAKLDLPFEVAADGTYEVILVVTKARDYGIVQFEIDEGTPSAPYDLYNHPDVLVSAPISLGEMALSKGTHRLQVTLVGCHPKAVPSYMFGLDFIYLKKRS